MNPMHCFVCGDPSKRSCARCQAQRCDRHTHRCSDCGRDLCLGCAMNHDDDTCEPREATG
jgi:hypothetical protein